MSDRVWDFIVVGTGMGGGPAGLRLAQQGYSVLFIEKGGSPSAPDALKGRFAELFASERGARDTFSRAGRFAEVVHDVSHARQATPLIGSGVGGSSALYGMVLERFGPQDFKHWPVSEETFSKYYDEAERLFRVRKDRAYAHPDFDRLSDYLRKKGLSPYALPLANEGSSSCGDCQSMLCPTGCKNDSGKICIEPAVSQFGAELLTHCEVQRVVIEDDEARGVEVLVGGEKKTLLAKHVLLAAGALKSPLLLLDSKTPASPEGLGNQSGLVGRNLMRHYVDLYALKIDSDPANRHVKEIGLSDFYEEAGETLGTVQSFGRLPPVEVILGQLRRDLLGGIPRLLRPLVALLLLLVRPVMRLALQRITDRRLVLASIVSDAARPDNRVWSEGGQVKIHYEISTDDRSKIERLRKRLKALFAPLGLFFIPSSEKNEMLAHVCGTCRMGTDPSRSVVDPSNRVHGVRGLYVIDSSFFPTSGGTNPALTIAANSLRVADLLIEASKAPVA